MPARAPQVHVKASRAWAMRDLSGRRELLGHEKQRHRESSPRVDRGRVFVLQIAYIVPILNARLPTSVPHALVSTIVSIRGDPALGLYCTCIVST